MFAFDSVWDKLAREGRCDFRGGAEYRRVYKLWLDEGRTMAVREFINRHANERAPAAARKPARKAGAK